MSSFAAMSANLRLVAGRRGHIPGVRWPGPGDPQVLEDRAEIYPSFFVVG